MPTLSFLGYELYDLALSGSGGYTTLRVRIDRPEGVTLAVKVTDWPLVIGLADAERLVWVLVLPGGLTVSLTVLEVLPLKLVSPK